MDRIGNVKTVTPIALTERVKGCCRPLPSKLPSASVNRLAEVYKALADPTRVEMVHALSVATEPVCVCDFTETFNVGQPTVSHHLAKLRDAGIVTSFKRGIWSFYELNRAMDPVLRQVIAVIGGPAQTHGVVSRRSSARRTGAGN
jgi:ArsR family transcriptional regulator, arsenate/arsenite/antimonite-responsive transcriptional repressor